MLDIVDDDDDEGVDFRESLGTDDDGLLALLYLLDVAVLESCFDFFIKLLPDGDLKSFNNELVPAEVFLGDGATSVFSDGNDVAGACVGKLNAGKPAPPNGKLAVNVDKMFGSTVKVGFFMNSFNKFFIMSLVPAFRNN